MEETDDGLYPLAQAVFDRGAAFFLRFGALIVGVAGTAGEEFALVVDDGDAVRREACDRGGDEMLDRHDLAVAEPGTRLDHDGGGRGLIVLRKYLPVRDHQMHARRFNRVERMNGARQFAFERAQTIDVLHEGGGAKGIRLVENLITHANAARKALGGELHADLGNLVGGDEDGAAIALLLVRNVHCLELGNDRGRFAGL